MLNTTLSLREGQGGSVPPYFKPLQNVLCTCTTKTVMTSGVMVTYVVSGQVGSWTKFRGHGIVYYEYCLRSEAGKKAAQLVGSLFFR